ncbi:MAG: hypothetical protein ACRDL7_03385, partial [Gaiellaceae bacterium]
LGVNEIDAQGLAVRNEIFAADRLGDAISLLYKRYAELCSAGPERDRATATAGSLAAFFGPFDPDRIRATCAADFELVDRRLEGVGPMRGVENLERIFASASEVAEDLVDRCDDVLALEPNALLVRWNTTGRNRESGGVFEWPHLRLLILGNDGRFTCGELFGPDKEREALARFDELVDARSLPLKKGGQEGFAGGRSMGPSLGSVEGTLARLPSRVSAREHLLNGETSHGHC